MHSGGAVPKILDGGGQKHELGRRGVREGGPSRREGPDVTPRKCFSNTFVKILYRGTFYVRKCARVTDYLGTDLHL